MKTGTTSITKAFRILGFRSFHGVNEYDKTARRTGEMFPKEILDIHDAFCDWPFPNFYKELDHRYPNSKSILTTRDLKSWLNSFKAHMRRNRLNPNYKGDLKFFDQARLTFLWQNHHKKVLEYFANRSEDFLIMNLIQGDAWVKLCHFLNKPILDGPFPHENQSSHALIDYARSSRRLIKLEFGTFKCAGHFKISS